jgi:hypothetical protein
MEIKLNTDNIKVLQDFFDGLSSIDQRKIFISGFRKAAKPLVKQMKADAPYKTGQLMRSFGTIEMPERIAILVGAKLTGRAKRSGWYGQILEVGSYKTGERFRRRIRGKRQEPGKASTGRLTGMHFVENAYNQTEKEVFVNIEGEWYNAIDQYIVKINRRLKK